MTKELLLKLSQATTDDERSWIVTETLIGTLSLAAQELVWAAAIPHWFNLEILTVLHPELTENMNTLYLELQRLSFVEVFPGRGHNIHERTRQSMLKRLWAQQNQQYRRLSTQLASYFDKQDAEPALQVEWLYHLIVANQDWEGSDPWNLVQTWINNFWQPESESLFRTLGEQVEANRASISKKAEVFYWKGQAEARFYKTKESLESLRQAIKIYQEAGNRLWKANVLKTIGASLQFLKRSNEALSFYKKSLSIYREVGDRSGQANSLKAMGDALHFLERSNEALASYSEALSIYREVGDRSGQANSLKAMGDALHFLERSNEVLASYSEALSIYREVGDRLGQANSLEAMGDALHFLERSNEALAFYSEALGMYRKVGDRLGISNVRQDISNVLTTIDRSQTDYTFASLWLWIKDYWPNLLTITGFLGLAISGILPLLAKGQGKWASPTWFTTMFIFLLCISVVRGVFTGRWIKKSAALRRKLLQTLEISTINHQSIRKIVSNELSIMYKILGFGDTEGISLYIHDGKNLILIGQFTRNSFYMKKDRRILRKNEGVTGAAWLNGHAFISDLPEVNDNNSYAYRERCYIDWNMKETEVKNLTMKSRTLGAYTILDSQRKRIGVVVFESTKPNAFTAKQLRTILDNGQSERLSLLLKEIQTSTPPILNLASREGF
jgi:tetratricopeptide (TPR) repeat protein